MAGLGHGDTTQNPPIHSALKTVTGRAPWHLARPNQREGRGPEG